MGAFAAGLPFFHFSLRNGNNHWCRQILQQQQQQQQQRPESTELGANNTAPPRREAELPELAGVNGWWKCYLRGK
jgi:hypothetical protein